MKTGKKKRVTHEPITPKRRPIGRSWGRGIEQKEIKSTKENSKSTRQSVTRFRRAVIDWWSFCVFSTYLFLLRFFVVWMLPSWFFFLISLYASSGQSETMLISLFVNKGGLLCVHSYGRFLWFAAELLLYVWLLPRRMRRLMMTNVRSSKQRRKEK